MQTTTTRPPGAVGGGVGGGPKQTQKLLEAALRHPQLSGNVPEDWNVDQVAIWLQAMGFESVADNFKGKVTRVTCKMSRGWTRDRKKWMAKVGLGPVAQEITGDILLELNLEALKELEVNTFGKRFKIQSAINALREETSIGPVDQDPSVSVAALSTEYYCYIDNLNNLFLMTISSSMWKVLPGLERN